MGTAHFRVEVRILTPFTIFDPTLVTNPFTFSDRSDDKTNVEPGSVGASNAAHSRSPSLKDASEICKECKSHSSSLSYFEPKISMRLQSRGNTMNIVIPVRGLLRAPIGLEPMADMPKWP